MIVELLGLKKLSTIFSLYPGVLTGAIGESVSIQTRKYLLALEVGEDHNLIISRSKSSRENAWIIKPIDILKVSSQLDPHPLRNACMKSSSPGIVFSFVYKFDFGHIAFTNGKLILKDIVDISRFREEFEKFDVLFPV